MNDDPNLGCCGYDEMATKPPTTKPYVFGKQNRPTSVPPPEINDGMVRRVYLMGQVRFPVINIDRRPFL